MRSHTSTVLACDSFSTNITIDGRPFHRSTRSLSGVVVDDVGDVASAGLAATTFAELLDRLVRRQRAQHELAARRSRTSRWPG
jgi:hypothetical protein